MSKLTFVPFYIMLAFLSGAALLYFQWPFYEQAIILAIVSVPIVLIISRKWIPIFLFGVLAVSLGYAIREPEALWLSAGTYVLISLFQFALWSIAEKMKQLADETAHLQAEFDVLADKGGKLRLLSLQEFTEQALWMMSTNTRKDRTWFMEVQPKGECPNGCAELAQAALESIAKQRDLVTSKQGTVYLLVKETEEQPLHLLESRLEKAIAGKTDAIGYEIRKTRITAAHEMKSLFS